MSRDGVQSSNAFEPIGNLELEDSCVLVNGDGLNIYHHKDSKYKPYKVYTCLHVVSCPSIAFFSFLLIEVMVLSEKDSRCY